MVGLLGGARCAVGCVRGEPGVLAWGSAFLLGVVWCQVLGVGSWGLRGSDGWVQALRVHRRCVQAIRLQSLFVLVRGVVRAGPVRHRGMLGCREPECRPCWCCGAHVAGCVDGLGVSVDVMVGLW